MTPSLNQPGDCPFCGGHDCRRGKCVHFAGKHPDVNDRFVQPTFEGVILPWERAPWASTCAFVGWSIAPLQVGRHPDLKDGTPGASFSVTKDMIRGYEVYLAERAKEARRRLPFMPLMLAAAEEQNVQKRKRRVERWQMPIDAVLLREPTRAHHVPSMVHPSDQGGERENQEQEVVWGATICSSSEQPLWTERWRGELTHCDGGQSSGGEQQSQSGLNSCHLVPTSYPATYTEPEPQVEWV